MVRIPVCFTYFTGIKRAIFTNPRLIGSWDQNGRYSQQWTSFPMQQIIGEDGCPCFQGTVELDDSQIGWLFRWGVMLNSPAGSNFWGIPTEINDRNSSDRYCSFTLQSSNSGQPQQERYDLVDSRRLGAQKYYPPGSQASALRFAVWAPNARNVEVVFGNSSSGYIADDAFRDDPDFGIDRHLKPLPMSKTEEGIWQTDVKVSPELANFSRFDHIPYMFRIVNEGGRIVYRTDLYSRCQIGKGNINPDGKPFSGRYTDKQGRPFSGKYQDLDGTKGCSVVINPDTVTKHFQEPVWPEQEFIPEEEFWSNEFSLSRPVPQRVEDLVIYELHLGSLGYCQNRPGNFEDAIALLPYLVDLGVNAVELLPMAEFRDEVNWGYETSHYFALEYSAGGRDQLKYFVRECHRHGIAVILDVVYNHFNPDGERAEWAYDSDIPEHNIYHWYEGNSTDYYYPDSKPFPEGGYLDNLSTGYAPRFYEEMVRKMFISSAVTLIEEFHVDGFRVDQTTSMHSYNQLHANGQAVGNANIFGAKFLREWTRTMKLIQPKAILIAEDHSDWEKVTQSPDVGGLGFDAAWYADFYHHLIGDAKAGTEYAKLIPTAGYGTDEPLAMDKFAGALGWSGRNKVVYHESHDEAGNAYYEQGGYRVESRRTIVSAANSAPLIGETRRYAEARCRFAFGMSVLSAGTPMFLMGEEIGAQKPYRYSDFIKNREDLLSDRHTSGQRLFRFYQDLIQLRLSHEELRSHLIDIIYVHNANRVIAFRRWDVTEEFLIIASLNNRPFSSGYTINNSRIKDGQWREIFNSDAALYGGDNIGNFGTNISAINGYIHPIVPANGFVVFQNNLNPLQLG
ncbi:1,4-alpha-glucan branching enzyme [Cylindrospermum stagnale PCC 7417]|uniref:1,4-alpha-glucan branching enzyme n=1 Tax=Cylindrospermum stagnale PCC 7417 TaxID=56107 RepID=K9WVL5_9NOST|nr:alpha-amylase family glycosyl hydrolase [Cylindrospermum stagnale]AFZ23831.1 1,4-alpha-glucan branching enzyme [Cylindrospermum stagnale PCC 7417]